MILVLTVLCAALVAFVVLLSGRLRAAAGHIAELRDQRDRDIETIAKAREEATRMSSIADELTRAQTALADAQAALAAVRSERDTALREAEAAHRQRHAFLAGLAHDLRNPLAPLSNGLELLRLTDHDPAGRLRTRGILERQVGHLMRIADELSDLSRLSGGKSTLHPAPFDLPAVLRGLEDRLAPALLAQEMSLALDDDGADLPRLRGDAQRVAQAVGHLVDDVLRHAERGSTIRIAAAVEGAELALSVATAGDAQAQETEPLEDVDVAALGLGVALAQQLAALHGGSLQGRRPPGMRRVRFRMTLPVDAQLALGSGAASASPTLPVNGEPALSVLLADDNVDFSHSFGTMLELLGHRVETVHDGLAAVSAIVASPPDIAFVDLGMPSLDGVETVRRVRGQGNTAHVVLVAVTGRGGAEDRARAAEAGFDRYLVKPFSMQDVRDALDAAQAVRGGAVQRMPGAFASTRPA